MDKYSPSMGENRNTNDNYGLYTAVPTGDIENGCGYLTTRKRNSKKFDDMEELIITDCHRFAVSPLDSASVTKNQKENLGCLENTYRYFSNFCDTTSIPGFKFLSERRRYIVEKLWWILVVSFAVYGSGTLIYKTYYKWITSPIVVSFETTDTPIWMIPFPAITICPEVNADSLTFNYTDVYLKYAYNNRTSPEEEEYFNLFSLVCNPELEFVNENYTKIINWGQYEKFVNAFADIGVKYCTWQGDELDCEDTLAYTMTSTGLCRTFNMLEPEEVYTYPGDISDNRTSENTKTKWSLQHGYPPNAGLKTYPRRAMLSGVKAGFQVDLYVRNEELDYACNELQGFKFTLHHPGEEPNMDKYFRIPLNQVVVASVRPKMIGTSEEIESYSPEDRHCYYPEEKILSNFRIYSQENCMSECLRNYTWETCGCFPFYVFPLDEETAICGVGSQPCVEKAKVSFLKREIEAKLNENKDEITEQCKCLPACTSINYEVEISQNDWDWKKSYHLKYHDLNMTDVIEEYNFSKLMVYYKDMQFLTSKRQELYGTVDFLANCGGLLGLFCGFSFISVMEILYYLTLRVICNLRMFGRRKWCGENRFKEEGEVKSDQNGPE